MLHNSITSAAKRGGSMLPKPDVTSTSRPLSPNTNGYRPGEDLRGLRVLQRLQGQQFNEWSLTKWHLTTSSLDSLFGVSEYCLDCCSGNKRCTTCSTRNTHTRARAHT